MPCLSKFVPIQGCVYQCVYEHVRGCVRTCVLEWYVCTYSDVKICLSLFLPPSHSLFCGEMVFFCRYEGLVCGYGVISFADMVSFTKLTSVVVHRKSSMTCDTPKHVKRDLHMPKETCNCQKELPINNYGNKSKETYAWVSPKNINRVIKRRIVPTIKYNLWISTVHPRIVTMPFDAFFLGISLSFTTPVHHDHPSWCWMLSLCNHRHHPASASVRIVCACVCMSMTVRMDVWMCIIVMHLSII